VPTENTDDEENNYFYDTPERTFDTFSKNCTRLMVGDLNAQLGRD